MKGAQVLEKTHRWIQDKLSVLSLEETRNETAEQVHMKDTTNATKIVDIRLIIILSIIIIILILLP